MDPDGSRGSVRLRCHHKVERMTVHEIDRCCIELKSIQTVEAQRIPLDPFMTTNHEVLDGLQRHRTVGRSRIQSLKQLLQQGVSQRHIVC